jgi:predicted transglutaminase-like cysteine proteinase
MQYSFRAFACLTALSGSLCIGLPANAAASVITEPCRPIVIATALSAEPVQSRLEVIRLQQENGFASLPEIGEPSPALGTVPEEPCDYGKMLDEPGDATLPQAPEAAAPATDRPDIFGSVALPIGQTPLDAKWQSASASSLSRRSGPWRPLLRSLTGMARAEQIQAVNSWVNARIAFTDDARRKGRIDVWSGASDTLRRKRGDCEDYAIAKMKLLEAAGVDREDMYLVIVDDLVRRADHALLVVRSGDQMLVLDNGTDQILEAGSVTDYRPVFSYSAQGTWLHGYAQA